jgi:hypothetical protein
MRRFALAFLLLGGVTVGCRTVTPTRHALNPAEIVLPTKGVTPLGPNVIVAEGHWRQTKWAGLIAIPAINAVHIECIKHESVCREIRADLFTSLDEHRFPPSRLIVHNPQEFRVLSWSDGSVVARDEAPVADVDLRISTKDGVVEKSYRETKARGSQTADPNIWRMYVLE